MVATLIEVFQLSDHPDGTGVAQDYCATWPGDFMILLLLSRIVLKSVARLIAAERGDFKCWKDQLLIGY